MSMLVRNTAQANTHLNAAGLLPRESLALPSRPVADDEAAVLEAVKELYQPNGTHQLSHVFSPQTVFTLSTGNVAVGVKDARAKLAAASSAAPMTFDLLQSPRALPAKSMCIDQTHHCASGPMRSLIVIKRRAIDGLVVSLTEERDHCRPSANHKKASAAAVNASRNTSAATKPDSSKIASAAGAAVRSLNYYSPTDNMLSPCTSKLHLAKKRHHLKGTPRTLFASQLANKQPSTASDLADLEMA